MASAALKVFGPAEPDKIVAEIESTAPDDLSGVSHMTFGGVGKSGLETCSVDSSAVNLFPTEHAVYNRYG